jgi:hypothetical protein
VNTDEIRAFVRKVINEDVTWDGEYECQDETVERIVRKWEADVEEQIEAAVKNAMSDEEIK